MEIIKLNEKWGFRLGDCPQAWEKRYKSQDWQEVSLPHDWAVALPFSKEYSSGTGYLAGGIGWYRKSFALPEKHRGKQIRIAFDGVYKNSQVWINGYYLGKRPNGYVPFAYDISQQACFGEELNVISVKVDHTDIADSRWYTGSGIVRKAYIEIFENIHAGPQSVFFRTPSSSPQSAEVEIDALVVNKTSEASDAEVEFVLSDGASKEVLSLKQNVEIPPGAQTPVAVSGTVKNPKLWDVKHPNLYRLKVIVKAPGNEKGDVQELTVGIRSFEFDHDKGLFLNSKPMKIKGVCVHHDAGCLGAAAFKQVWKRRLEKLKDMGCNAIRMSHNPGMPELYDLCDEMGFLVMDEAFDEWEGAKNKWTRGHNVYPPAHQGYFEDFPQWHKEDLEAMVLRDRNHPSVIIWSVGNEIDYPNDPYCHPLFSSMTGNNDKNKPETEQRYDPDRPNAQRLIPLGEKLVKIVKGLDKTRPVTLASAFPELSVQLGLIDLFDLVCYNYKEALYETAHEKYPDKALLGSENGHQLKDWLSVTCNEYVCGQFLWTGIDFLGEAFGWPVRGSRAGMLDLAGFEKPIYYYRKSLWAQEPAAYLLTRRKSEETPVYAFGMERKWNYAPGEIVEVRCYTNSEEAKLSLNGRDLGTKKYDEKTGYMSWDVEYNDGTLEAAAFKNGKKAAGDALKTAKAACGVELKAWDAAEDEIVQIEATVVDAEGVRAPEDSTKMHVHVEGARLLGIENGDQSDLTEYSAHYRRAYKGRMIVYVKKHVGGKAKVTIKGEGLKAQTLDI